MDAIVDANLEVCDSRSRPPNVLLTFSFSPIDVNLLIVRWWKQGEALL
jgi:hypothetical protein